MTTISFSSLLKENKKYFNFSNAIIKLFKDNNLRCCFLEATNDIWLRDFMPLKTDKSQYIQFSYQPSYLIKSQKYRNTITDGYKIAVKLGLNPIQSNIKVDGGNFIYSNGVGIMTERIISENINYLKAELINEIKKLLKLDKLILIPDEKDMCGHADGMVRFVNNNTVLINSYPTKDIKHKNNLIQVLNNAGLDYIEIPCPNETIDNAIGLYINYLQFDNIIILPSFDKKEDTEVFAMFQRLFKNYKILQINAVDIAKDGGVLNCISWNK